MRGDEGAEKHFTFPWIEEWADNGSVKTNFCGLHRVQEEEGYSDARKIGDVYALYWSGGSVHTESFSMDDDPTPRRWDAGHHFSISVHKIDVGII